MPQGYAADSESAPDSVLEEVRGNWQSAKDWLEPYHREADDLYQFLYKFDHYDDGPKVTERDRRRAKPAGRQMASKHRHKLAQILKQSLYITTRGVDLETDPDTAENVRWFMEYEVHDPQKRFRRVLRRAVSLMLGTTMGALALEVRDDLGDYPEIRPKLLPADRLGWTPGWNDPDDDTCPWVTVEFDLPIPEIERRGEAEGPFKWKNTEGLTADTMPPSLHGRSLPSDRPLRAAGTAYPGEPTVADRVKVVYCWYRHDHSTKHTDEQTYTLEASARYMACPSCPYMDRTQDGTTLPEQGDACPECMALGQPSQMARVDREKIPPGRYYKGRRLVVFAPQANRVFYDDDWPYKINGRPIRNVPVALFKCYDLPLEPGASCDTIWDFSYQVIANATDRRLYEWIARAGGILIAGMDGLYNASGTQPFEFTDRPISLARWKGMGQPAVEYFQPHGMIAELLPFVNYWNGQFRSDMGLFDSSTIGPERSKDIAVGTMRALEKSGEIPVDDHAEQVRETLGPLFGTWYDMKRAIMTERQIVRLRGPQGADMLAKMRGEELPNVDVIVGSGPNWDEFDGARMKEVQTLFAVPMGMDPVMWFSQAMPVLAEAANIPMELVRKVQKAMQPPQPPAGPPIGGGNPPAPMMGANGGPTGMPQLPPAIAARMGTGPRPVA